MNQILLVEDHQDTADAVTRYLSSLDYNVYHRDTAEKAEKIIDIRGHNSFSLIIMDIVLPGKNGDDLLKKLREKNISTPILMLTTQGDTKKIVEVLNAGADDYLTKPFSLAELRARVDSLLRRPNLNLGQDIVKGDFILNKTQKTCSYKDEVLDLRKKEYDILEFLLLYENQNLSRDFIISNIWGNYGKFPNNNTIDVHIKKIREKINDENKEIIRTVHGIGYKMVVE